MTDTFVTPAKADVTVKWDGFRCILSTETQLRIRSRSGWDMTDLLRELAALDVLGTFDGELVSLDADGNPDFPLLCEQMLMRRAGITVTYLIFDLLRLDWFDFTSAPYSERRTELEALNLDGVYWQTPETFDDGSALFDAVCAHELEGVARSVAAVGIEPVSAAG